MDTKFLETYTADDFVLDDDFREIVSHGDIERLIESIPEKEKEIRLAAKLVDCLHSPEFEQPKKRQQELWQQIVHKQISRKRFLYFKYAASLLLLIGLGSAIFYISTLKEEEKVIVTNTPHSDDALLILANGKTISIDSKQSSIEYSPDGSKVIVNDTSVVAQSFSGQAQSDQMIVPFGKRSFITLSEGTKVWLNSGSKLIFPPVFTGKTREVFLEGEAFFEVAKNAERPFIVKTGAFGVKVYGTKFNVQAYQGDNSSQVVLAEGKVSLNLNKNLSEEVFLTPNQKASISKNEEKFEITNIENIEIYTAWVNGYLTFADAEISDVLKRISRYYNVEISVESSENIERVYGKLDLKDDLERVLDGIAFISKTKYFKKGNKYVFMNK